MTPITLEICIDSVAGALAAESGGADRLELCAALSEGGLTPSYGLIKSVMAATRLPVMVMIRPRGGDFVYSADEFEVMQRDVEAAKSLGVAGVVFGVLTPDRQVDTAANARLVERSRPLDVTFHRAFDRAAHAQSAIEQIHALGISRVLTSGQASSAESGIPLLRELVLRPTGPVIMAGAGVRPENAASIVQGTGIHEIHGSASEPCASDSSRRITSAERVRAIRTEIDAVSRRR